VIETHCPDTTPTRLVQKLQDEIHRQQRLDTSPAASLSARLTYRQSQLEHINIMLNGAATMSQPRTTLPHKLRHRAILGNGKVQRLLLKVYNFLFKEQRTVSLATIQAVRESAALNQQLSEQTTSLEEFLQGLNTIVGDRFNTVGDRFNAVETRFNAVETRLTTIESRFSDIENHLQQLGISVRTELASSHSHMAQQLETIERRLSVAERSIQFLEKHHGDRLRYLQTDMAQQKRLVTLFFEQQQQQQTPLTNNPATNNPATNNPAAQSVPPIALGQIQSAQERQLDVFYQAFEDYFRGDRSQIRERLRVYLPFLQATTLQATGHQILDLGCGRGEWLELLHDHGYCALGLDINQAMLEQCQSLGLSVLAGEALAYLKALPDNCLGAVTGFHIVEHLAFEILIQVMAEAYRVVRPGGMMIFETPNPRNVIVGSCNFYFDPTHKNPIPPEMLQFVAHYSGFSTVQILPLNPSDHPHILEDSDLAHRFNELFYGSMDYAVIGVKE
jgi:SAM-dependent methyltransferase